MSQNWCIKLTEENKEAVISYLNQNYEADYKGNLERFYGVINDNFHVNFDPFTKEITFYEFKQMVVNELKSQIVETTSNDSNKHIPFLQGLENDTRNVFDKILSNLADLLKYKNVKYGNSVLEPLEIFKGKCKAGDRLDDKLARVKNSNKLKKNDVADLIGYLTLICVENGWHYFDEFKD